MRTKSPVWASFTSHLIASAAALTVALVVSETVLRTSSVQFVTPVIVVLVVHFLWTWLRDGLQVGFLSSILRRATYSAGFMVLALFAGSVTAPQPAFAQDNQSRDIILMVLFCGAIIAVVVFIIVAIAMLIGFIVRKAFGSKDNDAGPKTRLYDFGGFGALLIGLAVASVEGVPGGVQFGKAHSTTYSTTVDTPSASVWTAMQTATSPSFPLPAALALFPQPVDVSTDEGIALGANRIVRFEGREGGGELHLRVVERSDGRVAFDVLSDTTPYAEWIGYQKLIYQVEEAGEQTHLFLTLAYERRLSPAWFFNPTMQGASWLAVRVLAQDVKSRAETQYD